MLARKLDALARAVAGGPGAEPAAARTFATSDIDHDLTLQIDGTLTAMTQDEAGLLLQRSRLADSRAAWVRWLFVGGAVVAIAALMQAARMLNRAWSRSHRVETEQRRLAVRLQTSLDSLSQGVAVFDTDGRLINWNHCFLVLLHLPAALVDVGTPYAAIAGHGAAEGGEGLLETPDQIRHGSHDPAEPVVYEIIYRTGQHLEVRRTPMPDGGFVLTISDMTRRAQAEAVLRESQKMQAIGQLTGGIAHDFNNLLTVILGNLEYAAAKLNNQPALHARIERATWAAQRGAALTSQLLSFARKQALTPAAIDLAATVPELVPLLRRTLGEHIDVRYVETAGLWPALADPAQLESAVLNLALNARDAMPDGGRLTIELANKVLDEAYARAHAEVVAGDYTMLAVSDTGHGMTPEVVARVFEPFFTTKPDGKGTGLGMAMVFGFVKQSGGHVKIYSEPNAGTTVRLYLPRAVGAVAPVGQRTAAPVMLPRGSACILVVEDEPAVREIAVDILTDLGYRVIAVADVDAALRAFGDEGASVDLLLTDVVLPGKLRGRDLAERLTAIRPSLRVLFMSGYTENSIVHHGRLDDGVHLLAKPFKREQLARKVAEVLVGVPGATTPTNVVPLKSRRDS
jgi:signal transduction histidine kinase/CheY-like chemotaxis protein